MRYWRRLSALTPSAGFPAAPLLSPTNDAAGLPDALPAKPGGKGRSAGIPAAGIVSAITEGIGTGTGSRCCCCTTMTASLSARCGGFSGGKVCFFLASGRGSGAAVIFSDVCCSPEGTERAETTRCIVCCGTATGMLSGQCQPKTTIRCKRRETETAPKSACRESSEIMGNQKHGQQQQWRHQSGQEAAMVTYSDNSAKADD